MKRLTTQKGFVVFGSILLWTLIGGAFVSESAQASQLAFGFQQRFTRTALEIVSQGTTPAFQGLGYLGELRLRSLGLQNEGIPENMRGPVFDLFVSGGISSEGSTANSLDIKRNTLITAGMDFRLWYLFLGMQYQANLTSISTVAEGTVTLNFPTYGARLGLVIPLNTNQTLLFTLGGILEMGRAVSASTGPSFVNSFAGFLTLGIPFMSFDKKERP